MSAGTGTPAENSGLRDPVGDLGANVHASSRVQRWWGRWRLVPFCLLLVAVITATIAGYVTKDQLERIDHGPPVEGQTTGDGLPEACAPEPSALPSAQPWVAPARSTSEQNFRAGNGGSAPVLEGRDGFVFWGDQEARNFSQAVGRRVLSQEEMDAWYLAMDSLHDRLAEQGIDLVIQVVPAKWSIYPEKLPEFTDGIVGSTSLDYLRTMHPDLPVMDMREPLRAATENVYTPLNSHWTRYGGTVGWQALAECLTAVDAERYEGLAALELTGVDMQPENNEFEPFGFDTEGALDPVPVWAEVPGDMTLERAGGEGHVVPTDRAVDMLELPATTENSAAQSSATALILRDSQGNSISPGWQAGFATTWQYPHNLDKPDLAVDMLALAEQHRPDVVILEITERHLNFVPPITY